MSIYAEKGEQVTCENGHDICEFAETVPAGSPMNLPRQLTGWRQDEPQVGAPIPVCAVCGAAFYADHSWGSGVFHFADGWRALVGDEVKRINHLEVGARP